MKRPSLLVVFLSVFIDLIGFGIVMPLLPLYTKEFGAPGYLIGLIMASFSVMQFLFAPWWGKLSDRIGRRPVLLVSNAGSAAAYAMFAMASTMGGQNGLLLILVSRIFAGLCGANLSVASAYIADVTDKENRSKGMALIGVAFGLGFILGPAFGSFTFAKFGPSGPGWLASMICAANVLFGFFVLVESRKPDSASASKRPRFGQIAHTLAQPTVGLLILLNFVAIFCFAVFETTYGLLVKPLGYEQENVGYLIAYCGLVTVFVQGGIGKLVKAFGERKLIPISLLVAGVGMAALPFLTSRGAILLGLAVFAIGSGINRGPTMGLISILTPPDEQGSTLGVMQSAASLARIFAPIVGGIVYDFSPTGLYLGCGLLVAAAGAVAWGKLMSAVKP